MAQSMRRKNVVSKMRLHYKDNWEFGVSSLGIELKKTPLPDVLNQIFFNVVQDDESGIRLQPGIGVTFPSLRTVRDSLTPRHAHTSDVVSGFVFLNSIIDEYERQITGWKFEDVEDIDTRIEGFLKYVDRKVKESGFFESLRSIDDYVLSVEGNRWAFWGVMPEYLYALISLGKIEKAKNIAREKINENVSSAKERGLVFREADVASYAAIVNY